MNLILVEAHEVMDNRVLLTDRRARHIVKILRSSPGDRLKVGMVNGLLGFGEIISLRDSQPFQVELTLHLGEEPPQRTPLDLVLALPRPIMLKRILSQVTALGVGAIHVINANRVEKSFWDATILQEEEYRFLLLQGLEQAVDTILPEVYLHRGFKSFAFDKLPDMLCDYSDLIIAHPGGEQGLWEAVGGKPGPILLAIGPEGGWVDYEVDVFEKSGFSVANIGDRILKVDTAVTSLHGRLAAIKEGLERKT